MPLNPYLTLPDTGPVEEVPKPDVRAQAAQMLKDAQALPKAGAPGAPPTGATDNWLKGMTSDLPQPAQPKEGMFGGFGRALAGGAAEVGHQITGAANWAAQRTMEPTNPIRQGVEWANQTAGQSVQDWQESLSPQDRDLMAREWTSLDPHQTIWQGSPTTLCTP